MRGLCRTRRTPQHPSCPHGETHTTDARTGRRLSELSNTISTYADSTLCPAPSCSRRWRSSVRSCVVKSLSTKRMAAHIYTTAEDGPWTLRQRHVYTKHETSTRTNHTRTTRLGERPSPLKKLVLPEPLAPTARRAHESPLRRVRTRRRAGPRSARVGATVGREGRGVRAAPYTTQHPPLAAEHDRRKRCECVYAPMQLCLGLKGSIATCSL
jgi:hypothetical protein